MYIFYIQINSVRDKMLLTKNNIAIIALKKALNLLEKKKILIHNILYIINIFNENQVYLLLK